jgi:hypothetical protein
MNFKTDENLQGLIYMLNVKGFTKFKILTPGFDSYSCIKQDELMDFPYVNSKIKIGDKASRGIYTLEIIE